MNASVLRYMRLGAMMLFFMACAVSARAQARCSNADLNAAFSGLRRTPSGSAASGECDPNRYESGRWSSVSELQGMILHAGDCGDPWIGEAYFGLYGRRATSTECNTSNYGGGHWSSYGDLRGKISAYQASLSSTGLVMHLDRGTNVADSKGSVIAAAGTYNIISQDGNGLTAAQIAAIVAAGGGNIILNAGGNIVAAGGGNYRLMSTGGRPTFMVKSR